MDSWISTLGLIGALVLPFFNLPLILRIERRKSSRDVSLVWAVGALVCFLIMLPSGLRSADTVYKVFSIINVLFFSLVVAQVVRYRRGDPKKPEPPPPGAPSA